MGYYIRAFCTAPAIPDIPTIQAWLQQRNSPATLDLSVETIKAAHTGEVKPSGHPPEPGAWEEVALFYRQNKLPILIECDWDEDTPDSFVKAEVKEFVGLIGRGGRSDSKKKVLDHLKSTTFVVACLLPTGDMTDDGYDANGEFLTYFVENCGAMVQADGEGFYEGNKLILRI